MRVLSQRELLTVNGANLSSAMCTGGASLVGMAVGAALGVYFFSSTLNFFQDESPGYFASLTSDILDYYISQKCGYLGVHSKIDAMGLVGGALIGSVLGSTFYGAFI